MSSTIDANNARLYHEAQDRREAAYARAAKRTTAGPQDPAYTDPDVIVRTTARAQAHALIACLDAAIRQGGDLPDHVQDALVAARVAAGEAWRACHVLSQAATEWDDSVPFQVVAEGVVTV